MAAERYQDLRMCAIGLAQTAVSTIRYVPWLMALWRGPWRFYSAAPEFEVPVRRIQTAAIVPTEANGTLDAAGGRLSC
jgi:hypothetical protein